MNTIDSFAGPRYSTSEISSDLPLDLQLLLWGLIDQLEKRDYLQVFDLSLTDQGQRIVHSQEQPPYRAEYIINTLASRQGKVFVVDDKTHTTMLWSHQY